MSVNNVAFNVEDDKALQVIREIFRAYLTKDTVLVEIKGKTFTCILSVENKDMSILEALGRKSRCKFEATTGIISGTSISINVGLLTSA